MLTINTNLSSLIVQGNLQKSTDSLNLAIERMTTGYKINHASDNAANFSISTNMDTKIGAYQIAEENVSMGIDLVTTASDSVQEMQNKAERLRSLCVQAKNGTYGAQSLSAINSEAQALISEINRLYTTSQYNGIKLCDMANGAIAAQVNAGGQTQSRAANNMPEAKYDGFIEKVTPYSQTQIDAMESIGDFVSGATATYKITSADDLAELASITSAGGDTSNATFVLTEDIDLTDWQNLNGDWVPIGDSDYFQGTFDGNGHTISGLKMNDSSKECALFGVLDGAEIKNLGIEDVELNVHAGAGIAIKTHGNTIINNCYVTGDITGCAVSNEFFCASGGLVGENYGDLVVVKSYTTCNVEGQLYVGGLVGCQNQGTITINNSYSTGDIAASEMGAGGLVGYQEQGTITIDNSYSTGNVETQQVAGGLVGMVIGCTITNSYSTGNVTATQMGAGGLVGAVIGATNIDNSYSTGNVESQMMSGGLVGLIMSDGVSVSTISNSYAYGTVAGTQNVGSLVGALGNADGSDNLSNFSITNCQTVAQACEPIGGLVDGSMAPMVVDLTPLLSGITVLAERPVIGGNTDVNVSGGLRLQVGINGKTSSGINLNTGFTYDLSVLDSGIETDEALDAIDNFIDLLSEKQTHFGSVQNRLLSVLDEITIQQDNLISSLSTIRDADMAEVSSQYIQQQILQQASATLLATANQTPALALQLL